MNSIGNPISLIRQRLISLLPPRIDTLAYCLDTFKWTWTAMLMVKMYFRDQYDAYTASLTSPLTYRQAITGFYKLVEANDWFKVDWSLLESALEVYEDTGNIRYLHIPIYHIPVETYGQLRTDDSELARPIRTLENLLLDKSTRLVVWGRLKHIWQNPSQYPPAILNYQIWLYGPPINLII